MKTQLFNFRYFCFVIGLFFFLSCQKIPYPPNLINEREDAEKLVEDWTSMVNQGITKADFDKLYHANFISYRGKDLGGYFENNRQGLYNKITDIKNSNQDVIKIRNVVYGNKYSDAVIYFVLKRKLGEDYVYSECIAYLELNANRIRRELILMGPTEPEEPPFGGGGEY